MYTTSTLKSAPTVAEDLAINGAPKEVRDLQENFSAELDGIVRSYGSALFLDMIVQHTDLAAIGKMPIHLSNNLPPEATSIVPVNLLVEQIKSGDYFVALRRDLVVRAVAAMESALSNLSAWAEVRDAKGELLDRHGVRVTGNALRLAIRLAYAFNIRFHFELGGDLRLIDSVIAARNDIVHNRGIVSERYAKCDRRYFGTAAVGQPLVISHNAIDDLVLYLDATISPAFALVAYAKEGRRELMERWGNR